MPSNLEKFLNDRHIKFICSKLYNSEVFNISEFNTVESFKRFEKFCKKYSASTAENYCWRLYRILSLCDIPADILDKYSNLSASYKFIMSG